MKQDLNTQLSEKECEALHSTEEQHIFYWELIEVQW